MIVDKQLIFHGTGIATGAAITADAMSAYYLDRATEYNDILDGEPLYAMVTVTTTFESTVSITISFRSSTAADMTTNAIIHCQRNILLAGLTAGKTYCIGAIKTPPKSHRYSGFYFDVNTDATAGALVAWVAKEPQGNIGGLN